MRRRHINLCAALLAGVLQSAPAVAQKGKAWQPTPAQVSELEMVTDGERKDMFQPDWDVLFPRPGFQKTQPQCIEFLGFSAWLKPMFADERPRLERSYWIVSRNFVSAKLDGGNHAVHRPLNAEQIDYFHAHLDWGRSLVGRGPNSLEKAVLDYATQKALQGIVGTGVIVVGGFTVTAGAAVGAGYTLLALGRDYVLDEYRESQIKAIDGLRRKISTEVHAYRSYTRFQTVDGRRFVRERHGLLSVHGDTVLHTCYWPETGNPRGAKPSLLG